MGQIAWPATEKIVIELPLYPSVLLGKITVASSGSNMSTLSFSQSPRSVPEKVVSDPFSYFPGRIGVSQHFCSWQILTLMLFSESASVTSSVSMTTFLILSESIRKLQFDAQYLAYFEYGNP